MNIRKTFGLALTLMCALVMTSVFTACGGDDATSGTPGGGDDNKPVAAVMDVTLTVGADMFKYLNLTVDYYDADGKVQSELMTASKWTKTVQAKLPATLGVRLKCSLKDGVDPASIDLFSTQHGITYGFYSIDASGKHSGVVTNASSGGTSIYGSQIPEWLQKDAGNLIKILYAYDTNGNPTKISW